MIHFIKNYPVTVAYGSTEEETIQILFDGRFIKNRGNTGWIIIVVSFTPGLWDLSHKRI